MSLSVNTAASTLSALQALQASAAASSGSATGTAAASTSTASSTPSTAAVSTSIATPSGLHAVADGIGQALSAADAGTAAGQTVLDLLQQMRDAAGQAADPDADRATLDQAFQANAAAIGQAVASAGVGGTNLVDGSMTAALSVPLGDGASASLSPQDLTLGGPTLALPAGTSVATATAAASAFDSLGDAIGATSQAVSALGAQGAQLSAHGGLLQALGQSLTAAGATDVDGDGARLLALQISQQLSASGDAIANQTPQSVLSLFRS